MPKNRERQKANKKKYQEERLDSKNAYGITDSTPREMVNNLIDKKREAKRNE